MLLQINKVEKTYPNQVKALNSISCDIKNGMFGLLGPNGAGKSTLMRTIATLQQPDKGTITFNGLNIHENKMEFRKKLGYLPQEFGVYNKISAEKLLDYLALLKGVSSKKERSILIDTCLEITNLSDVRKKHVSGYSGGMKQRFGIAQLLLNDPDLIIVDEPTAGLDPAERQRFLNILREISTKNIVIFSTHIVDDIAELCQEMAVLDKGKLLDQTSPVLAKESLKNKIYVKNIVTDELDKYENGFNVLSSSYNRDNSIAIRVFSNETLQDNFQNTTATLEDYYFSVLNV